MVEASIARRYAKALLEIAKEKSALEPYLKELEAFSKLLADHPSVLATLGNSLLDTGARVNVAKELGAKLGQSKEVLSFVLVLIKKGRVRLLTHILNAYRNYVYELSGKVEAVVTSAKPLKESNYQEIEKILSQMTKKTVVLAKEIDPNLIAGLSVRVGGEIFDGTLRASLERLSARMEKSSF